MPRKKTTNTAPKTNTDPWEVHVVAAIERAQTEEALDLIAGELRHVLALAELAKGELKIKEAGLSDWLAAHDEELRRQVRAGEPVAVASPASAPRAKKAAKRNPSRVASAKHAAARKARDANEATVDEVRAALREAGKGGIMIATVRRNIGGKKLGPALDALRDAGELQQLGGRGAGTLIALA